MFKYVLISNRKRLQLTRRVVDMSVEEYFKTKPGEGLPFEELIQETGLFGPQILFQLAGLEHCGKVQVYRELTPVPNNDGIDPQRRYKFIT